MGPRYCFMSFLLKDMATTSFTMHQTSEVWSGEEKNKGIHLTCGFDEKAIEINRTKKT